jgi:hypothetical protein
VPTPLDIVIPVRRGSVNLELRYSLRSIAANVEHGRVFIVGHKPTWVSSKVLHIPTDQGTNRRENVRANMVAATSDPRVSDEFVLWTDDLYAMAPVKKVPVVNAGRLRDVLERATSKGRRRSLQATLDRLVELGKDNPHCYDELHLPQVYDKAKLLDVLQDDAPLWATLYGALHRRSPGKKVPNAKSPVDWQGRDWLSSSDQSFRTSDMGRHIRTTFAEQSRYA